MSTKRMRVFAGPNGSGKTTIISKIKSKISFGVYVNADDIEQTLVNTGGILFDSYKLRITQDHLQAFFKLSKFSPVKRKEPDLWNKVFVHQNIFKSTAQIDSYLAADLAEFIRQELLKNEISFTYETVMSHKGKIGFLKKAKDSGYKVYLYFIATEDPIINLNRVRIRVAQKGHSVPSEVIENRYYKSLENLKSAIKSTNRAYIFDNSSDAAVLIAEINEGKNVNLIDTQRVPTWFVKYIVEK